MDSRWSGRAATPTNCSGCMPKDWGNCVHKNHNRGAACRTDPPAQVPYELQCTSIHLSESGSGSTVRSIVNVYATSPVYLENKTVGTLFRRYHPSTYLHETNHPFFSHLYGLQQNLGPCTFLCLTMGVVLGEIMSALEQQIMIQAESVLSRMHINDSKQSQRIEYWNIRQKFGM